MERTTASRRQDSAAETRRLVLEAARELYTLRGYRETSIADIAAAAGVAVATVYTSVGGKPALLRSLLAVGVEDQDTAETLRKVERCNDPLEVLMLMAHCIRMVTERQKPMIDLVERTRHSDPVAADVAAQVTENFRSALRVAADRISGLGGLRDGVGVDRATDVLWYFFGLASWPQLVDESGWGWAESEAFLTDGARRALLVNTADVTAGPNV